MRRRVKHIHTNNIAMYMHYKWILFCAEFKVTLKPRLSEGSRFTQGTVTYKVDYIHVDDRIIRPDNVPASPNIYEENATVGPLTLKFSKGNGFETTPLKFQFNIKWALKNDFCSFPGCIIDTRSRIIEEIEDMKEIQSLLVIIKFKRPHRL